MTSGTLFLVSTPIGNLADVSPRAVDTLRRVEVVYAEDTRHTPTLMRHYDVTTPLRSLHEHNEAARLAEVLELLAAGVDVAVVCDAGTPTVSDPGVRVVAAAAAAGHRVEPIPGPSAVTAALAASGLPADRFLFLGFPPRKGKDRRHWMSEAIASRHTVVAFEAPGRLASLLADWVEMGAGHRWCVVCRELTKLHEEMRRGTVVDLAEYYSGERTRGEVTLVLAGSAPQASPDGSDDEDVQRRAEEWSVQGLTTREIADRLREEYGLSRNRAYELALRAAEGA